MCIGCGRERKLLVSSYSSAFGLGSGAMKLQDKTILITGASSGLGRALAVELSHHRNRIVVTARRQSLLDALADEIRANGSEARVCAGDATNPEDARRALAAAQEAFGPIDVAVLNVGGSPEHVMGGLHGTAEEIVHTMRLNYDSLVNFLSPLIEGMRERGGVIAWTGSPSGFFGLPKSGAYSASKAAGRLLMDTCRIELADTPIRFVTLYPGFTYTEGLDPSSVPSPLLIIDKKRAVSEMIYAIERGKPHHIFPKRIRWLVRLARLLGEPVRRRILALVVRLEG